MGNDAKATMYHTSLPSDITPALPALAAREERGASSRRREGVNPLHGLITSAPAMRQAVDRLKRVAGTDATVLLSGETGTGKELAARAVHRLSTRASRPLISLNLAAVPAGLVAAELFGHEAGAFTGAAQRRIGRFEMADRGTLFLDEVAELTPEMQVALLRVVQEGELQRLGSHQTRAVDVRLIAATNASLDEAVAEGRFRADLFYRLSVFPVHLPPLRERREDIPALAESLLRRLEPRVNKRFLGIDRESLDRLGAYSWPGNIRQLQNVLEQCAVLSDPPYVHVPRNLLAEPAARVAPRSAAGSDLSATLHLNAQRLIEAALEEAAGRVHGPRGAAARLGIPASTLESKIRRLRINKYRFRPSPDAAADRSALAD
jgi:transcriptional regulator with GAF, ATPase, and Fis domain